MCTYTLHSQMCTCTQHNTAQSLYSPPTFAAQRTTGCEGSFTRSSQPAGGGTSLYLIMSHACIKGWRGLIGLGGENRDVKIGVTH